MIRTFRQWTPKVHPEAFVHDAAEVIGRVEVKRLASVWPLAVLRADVGRIVVGEESNVQDLTVVHCDPGNPTLIGKRVTVGHGVILHGPKVGDGSLIGMGSTVMEADIGKECLIAAGSLVLAGMRVPPRSLVMGAPARVVRPLKIGELAMLRRSAPTYVRNQRLHRKTSRLIGK